MKIYTLTTESVCDCGRDFHSYTFTKKSSAQKVMREIYHTDKNEIEPTDRYAKLSKDSYEIYRKSYPNGDFIRGDIKLTIVDEYVK